MKKIILILIFFLFFLISFPVCNGNLIRKPMELTISMGNDFIQGNTTQKITVTNINNYTTNVSWYLEHPTPISYMRENKTTITNLSWIDLEPKFYNILPNASISFYVILNIPNITENFDKKWESWVTFKEDYHEGIFNQEYAVRMYIDTPKSIADNTSNGSSHTNQEYLNIPINIIIILILMILILILVYVTVNKKY